MVQWNDQVQMDRALGYNLYQEYPLSLSSPPNQGKLRPIESDRARQSIKIMAFGEFDPIDREIMNTIQAAFPLVAEPYKAVAETVGTTEQDVTQDIVDYVKVMQEDLDPVSRPFDSMTEQLGMTVDQLFARAEELTEQKIMRRYSAVLHHRRAGFSSNAIITP